MKYVKKGKARFDHGGDIFSISIMIIITQGTRSLRPKAIGSFFLSSFLKEILQNLFKFQIVLEMSPLIIPLPTL